MLKTWEGIELLVNITKRNNKTITCLNVDGIEVMDPFLISNHFNKFFSTITHKIVDKIVKTNKHFRLSSQTSTIKLFSDTYTSRWNWRDKSLNNKKAIGPNSIPTKVLKESGKTISIPLANLINLLFECSIFPISLKVVSLTVVTKTRNQK